MRSGKECILSKPKVFIYTPVDQTGDSHRQLKSAGCDLKLGDVSWHKLDGDLNIIDDVADDTAALVGVAVRKIPITRVSINSAILIACSKAKGSVFSSNSLTKV